MAARSNPLLLTDYSEATCAVAAEGGRDLLAVGRSLFEIRESGKPLLLMTLPERFGAILGIAVARDTLYFSTSKGVYAMNGNLVVPVVLGLGGPLHVTSDSLIVLDANRSHLYRIAWGSE